MSLQTIDVGEISGVFGVQGWVKVFSFTEPRENILDYSPWLISKSGEQSEIEILGGKRQGKTIVARLKGVDSRELAANLVGSKIQVSKDLLNKLRQMKLHVKESYEEIIWDLLEDMMELSIETKEAIKQAQEEYLAGDTISIESLKEALDI